MTNVKRVVVVHGAYGSPEENWFPFIREALGGSLAVLTPQLPTPEGQNLDNWISIFGEEVGPLGAGDVLVGHSVGAAFLLRVLERAAPEGGSVSGTLLVSSFVALLDNEEFDPINRTIVEGEADWAQIRSRAGHVRVWHGSDDPYVPEALGRYVADQLDGDFVVLRGAGHVNASAGYSRFPELVEFINGLHSR